MAARRSFHGLLAMGCTLMLGLQTFVIIGGVIKMIPLALMAVFGAASGLMNGRLLENFATGAITSGTAGGSGLMASTVAVAFAYEGWILATSINAELKDAKRNLPRALILGSFIVVATYILYYIGLNGTVTTEELMASGEAAAKMAFQRLLGPVGGVLVFALIVVSCAGTLNGLMLSCCRGMYALAARGEGPRPDLFSSSGDFSKFTQLCVCFHAFSPTPTRDERLPT